jgi:hypothetical protein
MVYFSKKSCASISDFAQLFIRTLRRAGGDILEAENKTSGEK